ncbi:MAG: hypothetical protein WBW80_23130 [Acidimicrobiales bacterium]
MSDADGHEADYWATHHQAPDALAVCQPEAAAELALLIRSGRIPTIGFWKRRILDRQPERTSS